MLSIKPKEVYPHLNMVYSIIRFVGEALGVTKQQTSFTCIKSIFVAYSVN